MKFSYSSPVLFCLILTFSCKKSDTENTAVTPKSGITSTGTASEENLLHFESLGKEATGIDFNNLLDIEKLRSPMEYINVYNGGGVAIGDINNDGLPDVYMTGNLVDNKLYLNKGDFKFEDITAKAGVASTGSWSTGATMYDVNEDGLLDIYVCRAYYDDPAKRSNLLYINNGDMTFTEQSHKYGIDDKGYSIVATFLIMTKTGMLICM